MPELPEVETIVRGLAATLTNFEITRVAYVSPHLLDREPRLRSIAGDSFSHFNRQGKYIIINLKSGRKLLIHLRMSGRLLVKEKHVHRQKHDHLVLTFAAINRKLVFRDVRKFGVFMLLDGAGNPGLDSLGAEATHIKPEQLYQLLQKSSRPIKLFLLDQTKIAGLGNIYTDESLYRAGIHPCKITSSMSREKTAKLVRSIRYILKQAIRHMGTTFDSYRATDGQTGRYAKYLKVYNNEGSRCKHCFSTIEKIKLGGRGTHFCPNCQKLSIN